MPQEDEKTTVEVNEKDEAESTSGKRGSKKLIMLGGGGLGVVILGVALAIFVLKPMMAGDGAENDSTEQVTSDDKPKKKPRKKSSRDGGHGESTSMVYAIKDIVVNPAGTGGTRFLSVSFGFDLEYAELASDFKSREPLVRDALITILSSKTVAELTNAKQKEIIRYQVKKRLSDLMDTDGINGVYYTDFVLQ